MTPAPHTNHYFVDEAGDLTFFDAGGRVIVGSEGVSNYFMVGVVVLPNPQLAHEVLEELRAEMLSDPYFSGVPSMKLGGAKTALAFHACKDLPEVRRDVLARIRGFRANAFVAIRRKRVLAERAKERHQASGQKLTLRSVYDDLVTRLFRDILHKADRNEIVFAKHAKWGRREAMALAIQKAKASFERKHRIVSDKPVVIRSAHPADHGGLQVADYYLWALQRMFELGEDRFFNVLRPGYRLIMDLDDKTSNDYGEWYSDGNPLTLEKILPSAS